jgi:hypothetical protein
MFGLLNPGRQDVLYRRAYARCCQHQRRRHGLPSLAFLSYESVLLYLVAADAGIVPLDDLPAITCCKLRRLPTGVSQVECEVARFCGALGMLLASVKLADDLRDRPTLLTRLANWMLRGRFREAFDYFGRLDPAFERRLDAFIQEHLALERRGEPVELAEYVRPTARAFGYVFALFWRAGGVSLLIAYDQGADAPRSPEEFLQALGEHVGSAIVAFDCAVDRDRDRQRGAYNPLPDGDDAVRDALALSRRHLYLAAEECRRRFGEEAHSRRVLLSVAGRLPGSCPESACRRFQQETRSRLQRWGLTPRRSVQLNEGLDPWFGVAGFLAVCVGALACLFSSGKKDRDAAAAKAADVAPADPNAPVDPAAQAALASSSARQQKKSECCCGDIWCCDCGDGFDCIPDDCGGCENIDCSGCDGCSGCDCNCG